MTDDDQQHVPAAEPDDYSELWGFLEDDGFDFPPIETRDHKFDRDEHGRVLRTPGGRPLGGKVYHVESPDAETGLRLTALADIARARQRGVHVKESDVAKLNLDDEQEREFAQQVLGDTYHELIADGVKWVFIQRMVQYAYMYFAMGPEVAEKAAREGLFTGGKALTPVAMNRAERRAMSRRERRTTDQTQ